MATDNPTTRRLLWGGALAVFLFQLLTLRSPRISADETLYLTIVADVRHILAGHWPSLNPIVTYEGPLDFWVLGAVYGVFSRFPEVGVGPWMVRLVPFLLFWAALIYLYREVSAWRKERGPWFIFFAALMPMYLVFSRIAFPQSIMLGPFAMFVAESLRVARTGEVRWLRVAALLGFSVEAHSTAFVGFLVIFLPVAPEVWRRCRREPARVAAAAGVFLLLAYPVLRNFPPPAGADAERGTRVLFELRAFLNMIMGHQPLHFWLGEDPAPPFLRVAYLLALGGAFAVQLRQLFRSRDAWDRLILRIWVAHFAGSLFMLTMCYRGRTLMMEGHERYFLVLVPGWALLQADAFYRVLQGSRFDGRFRKFATPAFLGLFLVFQLSRIGLPVARFSQGVDPSRLAAEWLERNCPRESCLAVAENFWNYWPIRFYTRDRIDLNFEVYNWREAPRHPRAGRTLAGCWYSDSRELYRGPAAEKVEFPSQAGGTGQTCFRGIERGRDS